ncbi:MAG: hypothetical protein ACJAVI_003260 [Candidatus Azotimanducaceae bacterium]|jgi:hypothetical protein
MSQEQSVTYAIVFSGDIVEGFQIISVKAHMAKMLKASPDKMAALFSGKPVVIKRTADKQEAAKYGTALKKVGADVKVRIIRSNATTAKIASTPINTISSQPAPSTPTSAPTGNTIPSPSAVPTASMGDTVSAEFTLAENSGDLFEPVAKDSPVNVNISDINLAENDGSPIVEPKTYQKLELDLSAISIAENDGKPIGEPRVMAEKVVAPDFGLDEPGALLETLKEEAKRVNPDVSSISLAFPGSDLLNPDEIEKGPSPVVPDVSNIKLVANRATFDVG